MGDGTKYPQQVALWDAINDYVIACGGDPSKRVYGNTPRMRAVAEVERVVRRELERARAEADVMHSMLAKRDADCDDLGAQLELLAKVRTRKHVDWLLCQLEHDRDEWWALAGTDGEEYEGEADERAALLDDVMALLSPGDANGGGK